MAVAMAWSLFLMIPHHLDPVQGLLSSGELCKFAFLYGKLIL